MGLKYVSIDLETSGTDPERDEILSLGLAIENTDNIKPLDKIPQIEFVIIRERLQGNVFAINMNRDLIAEVNSYNNAKDKVKFQEENNCIFVTIDYLATAVHNFLLNNGINPTKKFTVAGKNFSGFDNLFLKRVPRWNTMVKTHQRVIDPATSFVDWDNDDNLPNLSLCKERAGLDTEVAHTAKEDAIDIIKLMRTKYRREKLLRDIAGNP